MKINYWDCKFADYEEIWQGGEEWRFYRCTHKDGSGVCDRNNKWCGKKDECKLAELDKAGGANE